MQEERSANHRRHGAQGKNRGRNNDVRDRVCQEEKGGPGASTHGYEEPVGRPKDDPGCVRDDETHERDHSCEGDGQRGKQATERDRNQLSRLYPHSQASRVFLAEKQDVEPPCQEHRRGNRYQNKRTG